MALGSMIVRGLTVSTEKNKIVAPGVKMTSMAEMWPQVLRKNKGGFWVDCRDVTVGPYESKREASQDMGRIQAEICGWTDPENAKIYRDAGGWCVDRYYIDGPFETRELAQAHKDKLIQEKVSS